MPPSAMPPSAMPPSPPLPSPPSIKRILRASNTNATSKPTRALYDNTRGLKGVLGVNVVPIQSEPPTANVMSDPTNQPDLVHKRRAEISPSQTTVQLKTVCRRLCHNLPSLSKAQSALPPIRPPPPPSSSPPGLT